METLEEYLESETLFNREFKEGLIKKAMTHGFTESQAIEAVKETEQELEPKVIGCLDNVLG